MVGLRSLVLCFLLRLGLWKTLRPSLINFKNLQYAIGYSDQAKYKYISISSKRRARHFPFTSAKSSPFHEKGNPGARAELLTFLGALQPVDKLLHLLNEYALPFGQVSLVVPLQDRFLVEHIR